MKKLYNISSILGLISGALFCAYPLIVSSIIYVFGGYMQGSQFLIQSSVAVYLGLFLIYAFSDFIEEQRYKRIRIMIRRFLEYIALCGVALLLIVAAVYGLSGLVFAMDYLPQEKWDLLIEYALWIVGAIVAFVLIRYIVIYTSKILNFLVRLGRKLDRWVDK